MSRRVLSEQFGGWEIEAVWESDANENGPTSVTIKPSPDAPKRVTALGINRGVMRRAEEQVREWVAGLEADTESKYRETLQKRVDALPEGGPRVSGHHYYRELLKLFDEIELISRRPSGDIAAAMGVSAKTIRSQLERARELADAD